jgi:hypothetical protein
MHRLIHYYKVHLQYGGKTIAFEMFKDLIFLPLSACLELTGLCECLISKGMSLVQKSSVGTPLNCALLGNYAIQGSGVDEIRKRLANNESLSGGSTAASSYSTTFGSRGTTRC